MVGKKTKDVAEAKAVKGAESASKEKPRDKSKDIPFPLVYFGVIAAFVAVYHEKMYNEIPSWSAIWNTTIFRPDRETLKVPLIAFFVACPLLAVWRSFIKGQVFSPIAVSWAGLAKSSGKHDKFCEQAWLALHYFIATSLGYYVLHDKPWWPPALSMSAELAIVANNEERAKDHLSENLQIYWILQLGFYSLELITLLLTGYKRSDAVMYFFHHLYTVFLMAGSWVSYNQRIGTLVLILHDVGDIFLPIGKCYTYAEEHIRQTRSKMQYEVHKIIGMSFFVMFVIGFAIPRLFLFGNLVYNGFSKYHWYICCGFDVATQTCGACSMGPLWPISLLSTLGLLYPMHVYWFYLIVKMAFRLIFAPGQYDDVRSDDEKDD